MLHRTSTLSIFTRMPVPGEAKTRLIGVLGTEGAARLQREMTRHVVRQARILAATDGVAVEARVTGGSCAEVRQWLGVRCVPQGEGSLGDRLELALLEGLQASEVAAVIGGDCPTVDAADTRRALEAARARGGALIPATDGGFCLLALARSVRERLPGLLSEIDWGSQRVSDQTRAVLARAGIETEVLDPREDIDRPEDLPAWDKVRTAWYEPPRTLSVVIPTLNEGPRLAELLHEVAHAEAETIVVDGGSADKTRDVARRASVTVIEGLRGRANQMNAGAAAATSDAVLFLHADSLPPAGFTREALGVLSDPEVLVGAFRFSVGATTPRMKLVEWGTNLRSEAGLPYGDQGLFMRTVVWRSLGGFPDIPVMEDYDLVRAARRAGQIRIASSAALTSDRRWRDLGPWRYTALNTATVVGRRMGFSPARLASWRARYSKR
jgi:rSAM/selenodomain-associated transferase 2/rSAM/selenodomain-associated transferase 1